MNSSAVRASSSMVHLHSTTLNSSLSKSWKSLHLEPKLADLTVISQDLETFPAHKLVLALSSPLLRKLLIDHPSPNLFLRGISGQILACLLTFIYTGELEVAEDLLEEFLETGQDLGVEGLGQDLRVQGLQVEDLGQGLGVQGLGQHLGVQGHGQRLGVRDLGINLGEQDLEETSFVSTSSTPPSSSEGQGFHNTSKTFLKDVIMQQDNQNDGATTEATTSKDQNRKMKPNKKQLTAGIKKSKRKTKLVSSNNKPGPNSGQVPSKDKVKSKHWLDSTKFQRATIENNKDVNLTNTSTLPETSNMSFDATTNSTTKTKTPESCVAIFKCRFYTRTFPAETNLNTHMKNLHFEEWARWKVSLITPAMTNKRFCEPPCEYGFKRKWQLARHKESIRCYHRRIIEFPFVCDICHHSFRNEELRELHFEKGRCLKEKNVQSDI